MLNQILELCTSDRTLYWLVLGSDLSIAAAYFAIPLTMGIVLRDRKYDIPYPWLWTLFVTADETLAVLNRIASEVDKMAAEHVQRSQADYLYHGVRAGDGSIVASASAA